MYVCQGNGQYIKYQSQLSVKKYALKIHKRRNIKKEIKINQTDFTKCLQNKNK